MVQIIAAVTQNGGIGKNNRLLCHLPDDLKRFKELTFGHIIIMGRHTFESLPGLLPGRHHVVLTGNLAYEKKFPAITVCASLGELKKYIQSHADCFIIGGAMVYKECMELAQVLWITEIDALPEADAFFPPIVSDTWKETQRFHHDADKKHKYAFDFVRYERKARK